MEENNNLRAKAGPDREALNTDLLFIYGLYRPAPQAAELAGRVIERYHPHLRGASIIYLFRTGKWSTRDRTITGKAAVATAIWRCLTGYELVLIINEIIYRSLNEKGKIALLDNELSHFKAPLVDKYRGKVWSIRDHDVCEFSEVVKRHGVCFSNLQNLRDGGMEQLTLQTLGENIEDRETVDRVYGQDEKEISAGDLLDENLFYEEL